MSLRVVAPPPSLSYNKQNTRTPCFHPSIPLLTQHARRRPSRRRIITTSIGLIRIDFRITSSGRGIINALVHGRSVTVVDGRGRRHVLHVVPAAATGRGLAVGTAGVVLDVDGLAGPGVRIPRIDEAALLARQQPARAEDGLLARAHPTQRVAAAADHPNRDEEDEGEEEGPFDYDARLDR